MNRQRARTAVIAGIVAATATGCIKADMKLELQSDDTVDGSMIVAFSKDLAGLMGDELDTMQEEMLSGGAEDLPDNSTAEEYEDDDFIGTEFTFSDAPLDEFNEADMSITHDGDEFVVSGTMDTSTDEFEDQGELGDLSGLGDLGNADIALAITFPGEVLEHNGELDGTTVTWRPSLGEPLEINARASDSGGAGGFPAWLWAVIGVVAVAGIIGAIFWASRRSQNAQQPVGRFPDVPADATPNVPPPAQGDTRDLQRPGDEPPAAEPR